MICSFSKVYKSLFRESGRYYDLIGGRGRGGSYTGTLYFLHLITQPGYFRGCFLRQVLGDIRPSLWQDFKDRIEEVEEENGSVEMSDFDINESLMTIIYRPTGNKIICKGVTKSGGRTAKLKSIAGVTHVLIEETDELGKPDFDQLDLSLRTVKVKGGVKIIRIYNPPHKAHWLWEDYNFTEASDADFKGHIPDNRDAYFKVTPKTNSGVVSIFSTYHDNLKNLDKPFVEKLKSYLIRDPEYFYTVVLGLVSEGDKGRIFSRWKWLSDAAFDEIDAKSIFGLDFGLASPAGLVEIKIVKNTLYIRELNYMPLTNKEIGLKMCQLGIGNAHTIIADSAEPDSISKLRRGWTMDELTDVRDLIMDGEVVKPRFKPMLDGFSIYPATKGKGSVKAGISMVKDFTVYGTEGSSHLKEEYLNYKWALDRNKYPTEDPIDAFNHLIDPVRYVCKDRSKYY